MYSALINIGKQLYKYRHYLFIIIFCLIKFYADCDMESLPQSLSQNEFLLPPPPV